MQLYQVPRESKIIVISDVIVPPGSTQIEESDILHFHHIDGAYSLCMNSKGQIVHLSASTEVKIVK